MKPLIITLFFSVLIASNLISFSLGEKSQSPEPMTHEYWRGWEDSRKTIADEVYQEAYKEGYHKATFDIAQ